MLRGSCALSTWAGGDKGRAESAGERGEPEGSVGSCTGGGRERSRAGQELMAVEVDGRERGRDGAGGSVSGSRFAGQGDDGVRFSVQYPAGTELTLGLQGGMF